MNRKVALRVFLLLALTALTLTLPIVSNLSHTSPAYAAGGLDCNNATLKRSSESKGYVVQSCSGSGVVDYVVHCGPRANKQFSYRFTSPGASIVYPYDCGTFGYATSVTYSLR